MDRADFSIDIRVAILVLLFAYQWAQLHPLFTALHGQDVAREHTAVNAITLAVITQ